MAENTTTTKWCAGLPLVRQRPFEPEEQEHLQTLARRLRRRGIMAVLAYPLVVACFGIAGWASSSSAEQGLGAMMISGLLLLIVYGPMMALIIRDTIVRCRAVAGDLRCGYVQQFAGAMSPDTDGDKTVIKLREKRVVPKTGMGQWNLELLPHSRRVWRVQEQRVKPWIVATVVEVAQTPEMAAIAAQWLQPIAREGGETLLSGRRELSQGEQDELQQYARRLWLRPLPAAIGLTLWASLRIIAHNVHHHAYEGVDQLGVAVLVFFAFCADMVFIGTLQFARKLSRDAQQGQVVIVGMENKPAPDFVMDVENNAAPAAIQSFVNNDGAIQEILPQSRREWTRAGQPAAWRAATPSILKSDTMDKSKK